MLLICGAACFIHTNMSYSKTIVCFANSRKWGGRCVAGKEWEPDRPRIPGGWVRTVSTRATHELLEKERCYDGFQEPQPLDILRVPCLRYAPVRHQAENHVIRSGHIWERLDRLAWGDLPHWIDEPKTLWPLGESSAAFLNNRVSTGQEDGISLYLIQVERLRLLVGSKAPGYADSRRIVRGDFAYRNVRYRMAVTDPVVEQEYLGRTDGRYDLPGAVLCVSLGDPYEGYYYKLIATVLVADRFP